ncbi:MAG: PKD domain-containing protein [Chryseolinea sp.]
MISARLAVYALLVTLLSCGKEDDVVDCFGESTLVLLRYDIDATNTRKVKFEIEYGGSNEVQHIIWNFGDGKNADGPDLQVEHTYATGGTYSVTVDVHIKKDKALCTVSPRKDVTLN